MRFRYLKDPLFLFCVALYFINRWVLKPHFPNEFSIGYLNDVICIPIMLFIMRKLRLRIDDQAPKGSEILIPLIIWSFIFELYLPTVPFFKHLATSDYRDIISYTAGAIIGALFWQIWYRENIPVKTSE
jgi:hypothetical protein